MEAARHAELDLQDLPLRAKAFLVISCTLLEVGSVRMWIRQALDLGLPSKSQWLQACTGQVHR